jgi:hypothetical protein
MTKASASKELLKKLNTTGGFDTPWLKNQLETWNVHLEQEKADFMEHLYQVYKPASHTYTGLWERFCVTEAGPIMRERYFEVLKAIEEYETLQAAQAAVVS